MKIFFLIPFLLIPIPLAFADITFNNTNFEFDFFSLNITSAITIDSWLQEDDGFTTNAGEDLRKYTFNRNASAAVYNIHWDLINSTMIQFNVTDAVFDAAGNATGTEFDHIELNGISVPWTYTTLNIIEISSASNVEYFFPIPSPILTFNAIVLSVNSPLADRLGGVFSLICPSNSTLTGLLTNGTFVCSPMSDFFP